jgi:hypothetical protein
MRREKIVENERWKILSEKKEKIGKFSHDLDLDVSEIFFCERDIKRFYLTDICAGKNKKHFAAQSE